MTRVEERIFSRLLDYAVAPAPPLPPLAETDALAAFDRYLAGSPAPSRLGIRAALLVLELSPLAFGPQRRRLTRLGAAQSAAHLSRLEQSPLRPLLIALRGLAQLCYYGDEGVLRMLGYDAAAVIERGRAVRVAEHRW
jgi:hypothetical protein